MTVGDADLPYCAADELDVALEWRTSEDGSLHGQFTVRNTSPRACRVGGKPSVTPLGVDGRPLPAQTVVTMEMRMPGWVVLQPGARAASRVGWSGWCGDPASGRAHVRWEQGEATITVAGPAQPRCPEGGQPVTLWSSWFRVVDESGSEDR